MPSSVMIAEQSEIIRKGMVEILRGCGLFEKIREMACAANLMEMVSRHQPDVLFINPSMVDVRFREQIKNGSTHRPKLAAIVYSFHDDSVMELFDEIIPINDTRAKIFRKLNDLIHKSAGDTQNADDQLTAREKDVLKLLVKGMSNKEVSGQLNISTHTVMSHRKNITQKLNIKSVAGLTVYAILNGLISMDDLK
jgi:DNA-binding NarL/FixJ family response regulator